MALGRIPAVAATRLTRLILALGDYVMTLNGEDAAGNAAAEDTATLSVVDELPAGVIGQVKLSRSRSTRRYPARV